MFWGVYKMSLGRRGPLPREAASWGWGWGWGGAFNSGRLLDQAAYNYYQAWDTRTWEGTYWSATEAEHTGDAGPWAATEGGDDTTPHPGRTT